MAASLSIYEPIGAACNQLARLSLLRLCESGARRVRSTWTFAARGTLLRMRISSFTVILRICSRMREQIAPGRFSFQKTAWARGWGRCSLVPRPSERGKAWYTLFTHARIFKNDASQKNVGVYVNSVPFSLHSGPSGYKNRLRVSSTNVRCRYSVVSNRALNLRV